ncbi:hypothetical protein [Streptomyces kanamyceticus]|uniref:LPXTG cell wall anchor domain-containing protein n=1 Tax=Streptomyces kanamyceticus TaxID=1967 RepID=A0A5J6GSX8_STRKN|nr:hypothetical protein [Streptomyces kanamyceticus]QEU96106.1 hypothetical protein CP970_38885 [Streptomyces kanamyceticus]
MRTTQIFVRSGLIVAAAALPLTLAAPASAGGGITVTATGSTVQVTGACAGGTASLMGANNASFAGGQQVQINNGSGAWQNVSPGTYTVMVSNCSGGGESGPQTVTVGTAPTTSSTSAPSRGVRGGLGGGTEDRGTLTLVTGGALVAAAATGGVWYLRRRGASSRT